MYATANDSGIGGSFECQCCGEEFTETNPCCCDEGSHEDGPHDEGICVRCDAPRHAAESKLDFVNQRDE